MLSKKFWLGKPCRGFGFLLIKEGPNTLCYTPFGNGITASPKTHNFGFKIQSTLLIYYDTLSPDTLSGDQLDQLLALGWYRMHQSIFATSHVELGELFRVHWLRFPISSLGNSKSIGRIRKKNKSFRFEIEDFYGISPAHSELHQRYRASIDFNGANSIEESLFGGVYAGHNIFITKCISVFDGDKLIAGGYFDLGKGSAASILHFFDPEYKSCSLGKYLILGTIDYLQSKGYTWYYPGYVVEGLSKMNYKLFLGKDKAQYFDPEFILWKNFHEGILIKQPGEDQLSI